MNMSLDIERQEIRTILSQKPNSPSPRLVERIHALIHTPPLAYIVGPETELEKITPVNPDNEHCTFVEDFEDALLICKDGYSIRGLYLLPL